MVWGGGGGGERGEEGGARTSKSTQVEGGMLKLSAGKAKLPGEVGSCWGEAFGLEVSIGISSQVAPKTSLHLVSDWGGVLVVLFRNGGVWRGILSGLMLL